MRYAIEIINIINDKNKCYYFVDYLSSYPISLSSVVIIVSDLFKVFLSFYIFFFFWEMLTCLYFVFNVYILGLYWILGYPFFEKLDPDTGYRISGIFNRVLFQSSKKHKWEIRKQIFIHKCPISGRVRASLIPYTLYQIP